MTNKEAIKMQEAIKAGLKETGKDHPYRDALIPPMKESCNMAIEALETQDAARERYEDLCEYFNNNPHTIEIILNDRKELKAWLERLHWHVLECDKLARKLEELEGKDNVPDTNVGDTISRRAAISEAKKLYAMGDCYCDEYSMIGMLNSLPLAQSKSYKEKLKETADALSEKFAYMNTCLNERDIILGYLGVKRPSEIHCNTDCTNIKCESHYCYKKTPPAQPEIIRCKDCKDYQTDWETSYPNRHYCATMDSMMPEDGFCSYAERCTDADMRGEQDE